ncbi:Argininosuccinate synthase [Alphaproteobacteria bacterium]
MGKMSKFSVILAYSGGLDTSVMIAWLKENYDCKVITVTCDVGQDDELEHVREKAISSGAEKAYVLDCKEEFITKYLWRLLQTNAVYENDYLLGTISRPLIAEKLVEIANKEGANYISHGATGKGNDQVRFELTVKALAPHIKIIAPWREWEIKSRSEAMEYAKARSIPIAATLEKPYSRDQNIWYVSHEGGVLENPMNPCPHDLCLTVTSAELASNEPEIISIEFDKGVPVEVNGVGLLPVDMLNMLNVIGGRHGIGVVDIVENRLIGIKSRGVYEFPGATLLYKAHKMLESVCLDRDTSHCKNIISQQYANLVYEGKWFSLLREALDKFVAKTQEHVTGEVKLKLYKGQCYPLSIYSEYSLHDKSLATFEKDDVYNQKDAEGFINIFGLQMKVHGMKRHGKKTS